MTDTVSASPIVPESSALAYAPGTCNIGPYEIARRRRAAIIAFMLTALFALVLLETDAPPLGRALILLPLWASFVTLLQWRRRFCVGFAMAGVRNLGGDAAGRVQVEDPEARAADRRAATRHILDALLLAIIPTALFVILPL